MPNICRRPPKDGPRDGADSSGSRGAGGPDYPELIAVDPGHYIVGDELARGGMGRIFEARDRRLSRSVAIKELLHGSDDARARFEREARITARLQHPGIVNILEAGAWPSGEPFYAMKLVTGESLDKVIAGRATLEARLGLLPNVIAVVDALAYAHSTRIIHRDLKPGNVLVGEFGETVVIDWGLAKDLASTSDEPDVPAGPHRAAPGTSDTATGAVMGTPAYMPVEQANGEPVDERADVYSLGAMLYHVLAGTPPYTGKTAEATLAALVADPPPPLVERAPGIPPDLITIVNKAMARTAADRYPSAKELADDLKKFQTGQLVGAHQYTSWQLLRRWLRRHRTPVAVAAVATVLLATLAVISVRRVLHEQSRTEKQRAAAVASRGDAEDLMSFMLGDLRDKLKPLNKIGLLDDVAKKAVAYYDRKGTDLSDDELAKLAQARRNLADVLFDQGQADNALHEIRASLSIEQALAAWNPADADHQRGVWVSRYKIGEVLLRRGKTADALTEIEAAVSIAQTLASMDPTNAARQRDLAVSRMKLGDVLLAQGNAERALAEVRASLVISENLAAREPASIARQRDVAVDREKVANILLARGDTEGALATHRAVQTIYLALTAKDPANPEFRRLLAVTQDKVGDVLHTQGATAAALTEYRAGQAIRAELAAQDPASVFRQRELAVSHLKIGDVLIAQGDTVGALEGYRAFQGVARTLVAKDPTNADQQRYLWISHVKIGDALFAQKDIVAALVEYRSARDLAETIMARDPSNADRMNDMASSQEKLGNALRERNDVAGALAEYRASLTIREALTTKDTANTVWQRNVAFSQSNIGDMMLLQKDSAGAQTAYETARSIRKALAAKDPQNADWQHDVMYSHGDMGDLLLARGDKVGALAEFQAGLDLARQLQTMDPTNADVLSWLAIFADQVATCCEARPARGPR